MGKRKTCLLVMLIFALVLSLSGCKKVYTKKDMIENAEQTLEDKYGEEFQVRGDVFNVRGSSYSANVSPVNNPDIIFEAGYNVAGSEYNHDFYIRALIASQYKELAEKKLEGLSCNYYLKVKIFYSESENLITDTGITIEEFNNITEESQEIEYFLYLSKDMLKESDEYIYETILSIMELREGRFDIFFLLEEDLEQVKSNYSERYSLDGATMDLLYDGYTGKLIDGKKGYIHFLGGTVQEEKLSYEEFTEKMEVIREDAKQW